MHDFTEYQNKIEALASEVLERIFEISGQEMYDDGHAKDVIRSWRNKGDEGFFGMHEALEDIIVKVAFDINQTVQEIIDNEV